MKRTRLLAVLAVSVGVSANALALEHPFGDTEALFLETREAHDAWQISVHRGGSGGGASIADLESRYRELRGRLEASLTSLDAGTLSLEEAAALQAMETGVDRLGVQEETGVQGVTGASDGPAPNAACPPEPVEDLEALRSAMYACFARAASRIEVGDDVLDRLTVLSRLATTPGDADRRSLWLSLRPVWVAVNGNNAADSPYRTLIRLSVERMRQQGERPGAAVAGIGATPGAMKRWLVSALSAWRDSRPAGLIEPWDYAWRSGASARLLSSRVPLSRLEAIAHEHYRSLGANLDSLNVRSDLAPRAGKDPVAFCTFGARPRQSPDGGWLTGEPWVFATYHVGGLDNLYELMHEYGHAVHIAAIRTRPAFADWPDSDIFTEGVAELAALDVFDAAWQTRYLGDAASPEQNRDARFAATMMDMLWALFELQMLDDPAADPNALWSALALEYLRIEPHPEYAWWAVRGQLVDAPGYMMNYAAGAFMAADLRSEIARRSSGGAEGGWYGLASEALFRYGLERPAARVLESFLGRPVSPDALMRALRLKPR